MSDFEQDKTKQFKYYRDTHLWPLADDFNFEEWLNNFAEGEERDIAIRILDFFMFFPESLVNQMLATVIGKCGYFFKRKRGSWSNERFKTDCWYSFVPGEELKPTDSGYLFQRKLRDNLHIPEERIISYEQLHQKLATTIDQNVILVDDFVGSGHQTAVAWKVHSFYGDKTLEDWTITNNHCVTYAPLVVNYMGKKEIEDNCKNLDLTFIHALSREFNIFSPDCPCWNGDRALHRKAMHLLEEKSMALGIPFTGGSDTIDIMGYKQQGLALAFYHCMPDACPPIFYWETANWKPLMNKVYPRP